MEVLQPFHFGRCQARKSLIKLALSTWHGIQGWGVLAIDVVNGICTIVLHGGIAAIANACEPCPRVASVMTVLSACT